MTVQDVNRVVRQYDDMLKLMKQFGMLGGKKGRRAVRRSAAVSAFRIAKPLLMDSFRQSHC